MNFENEMVVSVLLYLYGDESNSSIYIERKTPNGEHTEIKNICRYDEEPYEAYKYMNEIKRYSLSKVIAESWLSI